MGDEARRGGMENLAVCEVMFGLSICWLRSPRGFMPAGKTETTRWEGQDSAAFCWGQVPWTRKDGWTGAVWAGRRSVGRSISDGGGAEKYLRCCCCCGWGGMERAN